MSLTKSSWTHDCESDAMIDFFHTSPTGDSSQARNRVPRFTPGRTEHERGGEPAPVGDTTRGNDRRRTNRVDDLRDERERGDAAAVAARFAALRNDDVGAVLHRGKRLLHRRDLLHHELPASCTRCMRSPASSSANETTAGAKLERELEGGRVEVGHDMIHRERPVGRVCVARRGRGGAAPQDAARLRDCPALRRSTPRPRASAK